MNRKSILGSSLTIWGNNTSKLPIRASIFSACKQSKFSCATLAVRGQPSTVIILENGDAFDRYKVVIPRLVPNSTIVSGQNSLANRAIKRAIRAGFNAFFAKLLTRLLLLLF